MKTIYLAALGILICCQLAVPFTMIRSQETILREGKRFRFRTRPIDPADPFQGRYVRLGYRDDYISTPEGEKPDLNYREPIYAILETDEEGFARFSGWSHEKPSEGHYLKTRYMGMKQEWLGDSRTRIQKGIRVDIPFDRYYMDEAKAPRAEELTREATRSTNCWVNARVYDGKAVIEDVFAEGRSLRVLTEEKE